MIASCRAAASGGRETEYGHEPGDEPERDVGFRGELLRSRGHTVRAAIRLTDELWPSGQRESSGFAPYPGPPEADEARWFCKWLAEDPDRWLIYVVRDFDATAEYWKAFRDGHVGIGRPDRRAEAEEKRDRGRGLGRSAAEEAGRPAGPRLVRSRDRGQSRRRFAPSSKARGRTALTAAVAGV